MSQSESQPRNLGDIQGLRVMVIDDSNTIRRSAEIFLGQAGCKVILAEDLRYFDAPAGRLSDLRIDQEESEIFNDPGHHAVLERRAV
jgi:hypothetical protein